MAEINITTELSETTKALADIVVIDMHPNNDGNYSFRADDEASFLWGVVPTKEQAVQDVREDLQNFPELGSFLKLGDLKNTLFEMTPDFRNYVRGVEMGLTHDTIHKDDFIRGNTNAQIP